MVHITPEAIITVATFREQTMNVRVPLQISAKSVENKNKTRSEVLGFVKFKEHAGNNAFYGMKKTIKQRPVIEKENTKIFINCKDTMPMLNRNHLK